MKSGKVAPNVLLMDESYCIREKTGYPFKSTGRLQVEDLLLAARISVFFIDDYQAVRKRRNPLIEFYQYAGRKDGLYR